MEPITPEILIKEWPEFSDDTFRSFVKLLDTALLEAEINAKLNPPRLLSLTECRPLNPEDAVRVSQESYKERLEEISNHNLYINFFSSSEYSEIAEWLETRKEYQNGHPKVQMEILYVVALSIMGYVENFKQQTEKKDQSLKQFQNIQSAAERLKEQIDAFGKPTDYALSSCIKSLSPGLDFLSSYTPVKKLRDDETYHERYFLECLVYWFEQKELAIMPALIKQILDFSGMPNLGANDRNLRANIKSCRARKKKQTNKLMAWHLMKR